MDPFTTKKKLMGVQGQKGCALRAQPTNSFIENVSHGRTDGLMIHSIDRSMDCDGFCFIHSKSFLVTHAMQTLDLKEYTGTVAQRSASSSWQFVGRCQKTKWEGSVIKRERTPQRNASI
jgi:hypothetical protein